MTETYRITLTWEAASALDALAERRNAHWVKRQVQTKKMAPDLSDVAIHQMGAYGEYGCCVLLGIPFNWADDRSDGHIDGRFWDMTVQIKATAFGNHLLVFSDFAHFSADLAILTLVNVDQRLVQIVGWVSQKDFQRRHEMKTVLDAIGDQPVVPMERLRPIETLVPALLAMR